MKPEESTRILIEGEEELEEECPYCDSENIIYDEELDIYQCLDCGEVWTVEEE